MILMIFLFPLISFGLCAWMAVFGFYLRLEEKAWARSTNLFEESYKIQFNLRIKRKRKKEKIENILSSDWIKTHSKEDLTEVKIFSSNSNLKGMHFRVCMICAPTVWSRVVFLHRGVWRKY